MSLKNVPLIDWRFGDKYYVIEFVRPDTYEVERVSEELKGKDDLETFLNVCKYIRDNFYYPLDWRKQPSCDGQFLKSRRGLSTYHFRRCVPYMWMFPSEVINCGFGICIDTALLCTSIFRKLGFISYVTLGALKDKKGRIIGYHAWTETLLRGKWFLIETTIHTKSAVNHIPREDGYNGRWGIYYVPFAWFNEKEYIERESILQFVKFFGKSKREIRKMEKRKQNIIWKVFDKIDFNIKEVIEG